MRPAARSYVGTSVDHSRRSLGIGSAVSAAAHIALALLLSLAPSPIQAAAPTSHAPMVVTLAPTPSPAPVPVRPSPRRPSPVPAPAPAPVRPIPRRPSPVPVPVPVPAPSPDLHDLLHPSRVAQLDVLRDAPGPTQPGPPAPRDLPPTGPARTERQAVADTERWLARESRRGPSHRREAPTLTLHPDGTRTWQGPNFSAIVRPDGEVVFSDQPSLTYDWMLAEGTIDPERIAMEVEGQDPFVAERIWFMESTETLRDELEDAARAARAERALARLRGQLARLWQDEARSPRERRRALFALWDAMADDESGEAARETVRAFVAETLPAGSPDAYEAGELAHLNTGRESRERFAPY